MSSKINIEKICNHCGGAFIAHTTKTRYCSHKCASRAYKERQRTGKINTVVYETEKTKGQSYDNIRQKVFLTIDEVCQLIGTSRSTIYRMFHRGELPARKFGRKTFIRRKDIDSLFEKEAIISAPEQSNNEKPITEFYTIQDVEKIYNIKYGRLNQIISKHGIPTKIFENRLHISKPDLDKYMKKHKPDHSNITEWYTVKEIMEKYGITRDQVYGRVSDNNIPRKRVGKYTYISKKHFDDRFQLKIYPENK